MADQSVKLFLSCVSNEFGDYRDALRRALTRPNVEVKIQEDFKLLGGDTLRMLEDYIAQCEAVVHFVGEMSGSIPGPSSVDDLLARRPRLEAKLAKQGAPREALASLTYTQWEAWLAIAFDKDLLIVEPAATVERGPKFNPTDASRASELDHLKRLRAINRYPGPAFTSADNLVAQIFASAVIKALVKAEAMPVRQPRNLPFASLGTLFMGRDEVLDKLRTALTAGKEAAVVGRALHGLGGVGKTRLAIEYAWRHQTDYLALLFVRADDPATLNANLAALAAAGVLDLAQKEATQDAVKIEAVLNWLDAHPTWLMILDNVDDEKAVAAAAKLMARLKGGHVIITGRAANFPASLPKLELGVIDEDAATELLLKRTRDDRVLASDDADRAQEIARELDGLALGIEQAGAYISTERIGFAEYLKLWRESRQKVVDWLDTALMSSDNGLATTWATSVDRLTPESRRLLERLAMLAPDPIPNSLLEVPAPRNISTIIRQSIGDAVRNSARQIAFLSSRAALTGGGRLAKSDSAGASYGVKGPSAGLYAYSLITRAGGEDGMATGFVMHRLVQDFARRAMTLKRDGEALRETLGWVYHAFVGDPDDVRSWPVLDPIAPHVLAVARRADQAAIAEPTGKLLSHLGSLLKAKARYAEAEPLLRRTLAISEATYGRDHAEVATCLNNLAGLLRATNRPSEAEPLFRRALAIDEATLGPHHRHVASTLNSFADLLRATNRHAEAEPLVRRALAIAEATLGPSHASVAIYLNNLAELLRETKRFGEAGPLYRRALAIWETSYGPDHPDVARGLNNLAGFLEGTKRSRDAEPLFRRALAIFEKSLGADHPDAVSVRRRLTGLKARRR